MKKSSIATFYGILLASIFLSIFFLTPPAQAEGTCKCANGGPTVISCNTDADCRNIQCGSTTENGTCGGGGGGTPTPTGTTPSGGKLDNPLSGLCGSAIGQKCVQIIIGNVIKSVLGIVGSIALLMMTWGGFRWLTAMGNSERVEKGKETLIWAALGLIIIFSAYAITSYVIDKLVGK